MSLMGTSGESIDRLWRKPVIPGQLFLRRSISGVIIVLLFHFSDCLGQETRWKTWAEAGTFVGNNSSLPLWLRANQFGTVPLKKPVFTGRAGLHFDSKAGKSDTTKSSFHRNFGWGFGAEAVYNAGRDQKQVLLPEAFAKVQWKKLEFWAGRRKEILGIVDTTLSSGSFTWSGNALPVPKVQIGFPQYLPLGFLKNYISLKGFFSHGWYNTPYIQGAYLHQKALHIRLGKPTAKFNFQVGMDHHVTWGGHADYLKLNPHVVDGKLADSFNDYLHGVVLAKLSKEFHNSRFTNFDGENRIGNHVGQFDFAFEYKMKTTTWLFYNNHPFEDASGVVFRNMPDGLYGLSWRKSKPGKSFVNINGFVLEYLFSKDQSGAGWNVAGSRFKGNDNYFNHGQYAEGWSYFGKGMGTPLIAPRSEIRPEAMGVREFFPSSRVVAYHLGLKGTVADRIQWLAKATFSTNFGTNNIAFEPPVRQFSSLLTADAPLFKTGNTRLMVKLAYDQGDFLASSFAGYIGLRSSGWIK
jgi:hypothetical protein